MYVRSEVDTIAESKEVLIMLCILTEKRRSVLDEFEVIMNFLMVQIYNFPIIQRAHGLEGRQVI